MNSRSWNFSIELIVRARLEWVWSVFRWCSQLKKKDSLFPRYKLRPDVQGASVNLSTSFYPAVEMNLSTAWYSQHAVGCRTRRLEIELNGLIEFRGTIYGWSLLFREISDIFLWLIYAQPWRWIKEHTSHLNEDFFIWKYINVFLVLYIPRKDSGFL